jgi:hypothetical protein
MNYMEKFEADLVKKRSHYEDIAARIRSDMGGRENGTYTLVRDRDPGLTQAGYIIISPAVSMSIGGREVLLSSVLVNHKQFNAVKQGKGTVSENLARIVNDRRTNTSCRKWKD